LAAKKRDRKGEFHRERGSKREEKQKELYKNISVKGRKRNKGREI
jgi:hypothetical protein